MTTNEYEYKVLRVFPTKGVSTWYVDTEGAEERLNASGKAGWEVIGQSLEADRFLIYTLKRIKQPTGA